MKHFQSCFHFSASEIIPRACYIITRQRNHFQEIENSASVGCSDCDHGGDPIANRLNSLNSFTLNTYACSRRRTRLLCAPRPAPRSVVFLI